MLSFTARRVVGTLVLFSALLACKRHAKPAPPPPVLTSTPTSTSRSVPAAGLGVSPTSTVPSTPASAEWGTLVPSHAKPTQQCAVFGSFALDQRASAEALRAKLVPKVPSVEVHDASEFLELAWGELVVVATAPDRTTADARVTEASGIHAGYVKACSPLTGSLATGSTPPTVDESSEACIGWNPSLGSALCITGTFDVHQGYDLTAQEIGGGAERIDWLKMEGGDAWFQAKVDPEAVTKVRDIVKSRKYVALTGQRARPLAVGAELAWAVPKITFRYRRWTLENPNDSEVMVHDSISIECKGSERELFNLHTFNIGDETHGNRGNPRDGASRPSPPLSELHYAPAEHRVLVVWNPAYAFEGTFGDAAFAAMVDLDHEECR